MYYEYHQYKSELRRKEMKKNIKSVCMMLIFVLAVLGLTACGKTELPFNDYVSLEYVGYDGKATASIDFNYSRMMKDFSEQLSNDETSKLAKQLRKIELTSEKLENLSNGDVVKITFKASERLEEKYKIKISFKDNHSQTECIYLAGLRLIVADDTNIPPKIPKNSASKTIIGTLIAAARILGVK